MPSFEEYQKASLEKETARREQQKGGPSDKYYSGGPSCLFQIIGQRIKNGSIEGIVIREEKVNEDELSGFMVIEVRDFTGYDAIQIVRSPKID